MHHCRFTLEIDPNHKVERRMALVMRAKNGVKFFAKRKDRLWQWWKKIHNQMCVFHFIACLFHFHVHVWHNVLVLNFRLCTRLVYCLLYMPNMLCQQTKPKTTLFLSEKLYNSRCLLPEVDVENYSSNKTYIATTPSKEEIVENYIFWSLYQRRLLWSTVHVLPYLIHKPVHHYSLVFLF